MIKKSVIIDIDTGDSAEKIDELKKSINEVGTDATKSMHDTEEAVKGVGEAGAESEKGLNKVSTGFKGIGTAMKAAGIGLIIALFVTLKEVLGKNQAVMDGVESVMTTISLTFNAVTSAITDAYNSVSELTGGFDAGKAVIMGFINLALAPLKLQFYGLKLGLIAAQLAWEKSFLGKGRPEKIEELQKSLQDTKDDINDVVVAAKKSGKDIIDNFSEAISEVGELGSAVVTEIGKVSIVNLKAQADAIVALKNAAEIAAAVNRGLLEDYDRQAELQRQIRDDVNKSLVERQDANNKLNAILAEQETAMLKNADLVVQAAQNEIAVNNSIENQVKLIEALNEKKAVLALIEGKRSEQIVNQTTLLNEQLTLTRTATDAEAVRAIAKREADANAIKNDELRLVQQKINLEIDKQLELARLQNIIDTTKAGTQARTDAEQVRLDRILEFATREDELNAEIEQQRRDTAMEIAQFDADNEWLSFELRREALLEQMRLLNEDEALSNEEKYQQNFDLTQRLNQLELDKIQVKRQAFDDVLSIFGAESKMGRAALIGKQLLAAQELLIDLGLIQSKATKAIATASLEGASATGSVATGLAATLALGFPAAIPALIGYAATAVGIVAGVVSAVKGTKQVASQYGGAGGGGTSAASVPTIPSLDPSFNVVGTGSTNQLAESLAEQNSEPVKAYVVSTDMTTQQELDRNIEDSASFG